eukprot:TRINITY_DN8249_c0_g1_i1.p1 TRINITY_DN8249_c0_g1~~TRINITY_DN8249_c0_g1_i1.p1  ORF type:complete len:522 (-),score=90.68 TRINITY_DN8249_c0_g1_i1:29-1594(-)
MPKKKMVFFGEEEEEEESAHRVPFITDPEGNVVYGRRQGMISRIIVDDGWESEFDGVLLPEGNDYDTDYDKRTFYRPRMAFIFVFLMLYNLSCSFGQFPQQLRLIEIFESAESNNRNAIADASVINGRLSGLQAAGQFIALPLYATLSNHFGRKPFFMISTLAFALDISTYLTIPPIWPLWISKTILGFTDSIWTMAWVAVTDVTEPDSRAFGFAMIGIATGITGVGSPMVAGWLSDRYGYNICFKISLAAMLVTMIGLLLMPETNRRPSMSRFTWSSVNPLATFYLLFENKTILLLSCIITLNSFSITGFMSVFFSWVKLRFEDISNLEISTFSAALGAALVVAGPITKWMVPKVGEKTSSSVSMYLVSFSVVILPFLPSWKFLHFFIFLRILCFSVVSPTLHSLVLRQLEGQPDKQVRVLSALGVVKTVANSLCSLVFPPIFQAFVDPKMKKWSTPNAVYYIVAFSFFVCGTILSSFFILQRKPKEKRKSSIIDPYWDHLNSVATLSRSSGTWDKGLTS